MTLSLRCLFFFSHFQHRQAFDSCLPCLRICLCCNPLYLSGSSDTQSSLLPLMQKEHKNERKSRITLEVLRKVLTSPLFASPLVFHLLSILGKASTPYLVEYHTTVASNSSLVLLFLFCCFSSGHVLLFVSLGFTGQTWAQTRPGLVKFKRGRAMEVRTGTPGLH